MQLALPLLMVVRDPTGLVARGTSALRAPKVAANDEELAQRIGRGDRWAEEALYRRYIGTIYATVRRLLGSTSEAEDVVQETFACAFEIWDQLREPARVKHWLLQIAVRKVHRRFRRRKLLRSLGLDRTRDDASLASMATTEATAEMHAELTLLDRVLRRLPATERIAWMLRYVEGLSLDEIAENCECSLATAKRRISAAHLEIERHVHVPELPGA